MVTRIAINGFGRIGRLAFRIAFSRPDLEIVAINDLVAPDNLAYLLEFDSVHRRFEKKVSHTEKELVIDGKKIRVFAEKDPTKLPWKELKIDYVIECTGRFTKLEEAKKHLAAGAKRVILSAPAKDPLPTFVMGVNHQTFYPK
ncbi:MAG: glyceraldehyde 3-phosphate dehydrogenase NAD-binding domain-containing protein, partial [Parachlamydiales bacterium]